MTVMSLDGDAARPVWRRWLGSIGVQAVLAVVVVGMVLSFVAKPFAVPSGSMLQTLRPGDRVIVNRLAYRLSTPQSGDVVVFDPDASWGGAGRTGVRGALASVWGWTGFGPTGPHTLVKRVIAVGGQTASCCSAQGSVLVDGAPLAEPYLGSNQPFVPGSLDCSSEPRSMRCFSTVKVPRGRYLVLGDNRTDSSDSAFRCRSAVGPVRSGTCWRWAGDDGIVGRASWVVWPPGRIHPVR